MMGLRKNVSTPRENQRHVLLMGLAMFVAVLVLQKPFERAVERIAMPGTPITGHIEEVVRTPAGVLITYEPRPTWPVHARWIAQLRTPSGDILFTKASPGRWSYSPDTSRRNVWSWAAFWEDHHRQNVPSVPERPFMICLRYEGTGSTGGIFFETEYVCSDVIDLPSDA